MNEFGISLYVGSGYEKNKKLIEKAKKYNAKYVFTSIHIPEEKTKNYLEEIEKIINICKINNLKLIVDIGPKTLDKLGFNDFMQLKKTNITYLRLDYGFSYEKIVELSKEFFIVFNASTILEKDIEELKNLNVDFSKFLACHNFYPKPLTGLSLNKVAQINKKFKKVGIRTMAFIPGDEELRGPINMGLPTVENHRNGDTLINAIQLIKETLTDIFMIGDIDLTKESWVKLKEFSEGYISLHARINNEYLFVKNIMHHDRIDSSDYVIRSQESREFNFKERVNIAKSLEKRPKGSISIGNYSYLRYSGELEIARQDLPSEPKVNIVGQVDDKDIKYLDYINDGMGFKFI